MDGMLDEEADQVVAVLDAQRATTLAVTRKIKLIKQLAALLNQVPHITAHVQDVEAFYCVSISN